ncbi:SpaH/EbpB family LPXTG-anchored major pilin [Bifidobacteriaceae bacterium NR002]|nr:SpaH/EbpB family LPXTG-anchored major pilin [Bifidobacteriaceae bacterium NR002]MDZ7549334.1 SpaH/EbpB family LPXTG-anchored major pilin [Bifidobacteriaceae bacterium NR047]
MRLNKISLKQAVAMLAATCTLGTCCIAGSVAWAEGDQNKANTANIDTTKNNQTSITIHKYEGPETTTRSNGNKMSITDKKPVKGVKFKLSRVELKAGTDANAKKIDLSDSKGWAKIKELGNPLTAGATLDAYSLTHDTNAKYALSSDKTVGSGQTAGNEVTTNDDGTANFPNLPMGLYYVEETDVKDAEIKGTDSQFHHVTITERVKPFFITTPLPNSDTNTKSANPWLYDVNVYPKNDITTEVPTKTASDPSTDDLTDNTTITWMIAIPLSSPTDTKNNKYEKVGFKDKLVDGLSPNDVNDNKGIKSANIVYYNKTTGAKLTSPAEETLAATDYTVTVTNQLVSFSLNKYTGSENKGLKKAETARTTAGTDKIAKLVVELETKVDKTFTGNISNLANTFVDDSKTGSGDDDNNPCKPGDTRDECKTGQIPVDTVYRGTMVVNKQDSDNNNKPLNDAEFNVYEITGTKTSGTTTTKYGTTDIHTVDETDSNGSKTYSFKTSNGTAIDSKLVSTTLKTKEDTKAKTNGTDSVNLFVYRKSQEKEGTNRVYCVVETKAPAGFERDYATPHCVSLATDTVTDGNTTIPEGNKLTIGNKHANALTNIVGALPMTGARGLVILTLCGIVGIASTFFYIVMKRRKEQEQE